MTRHSRCLHIGKTIAWPALVVLTVLFAALIAMMVYPYKAVTFPDGSVGVVTPARVEQGSEILVTFPAFCNEGVDVEVAAYADRVVENNVVAEVSLPVTWYFDGQEQPYCARPAPVTMRLPNYVVGGGGEAATFRLRAVVTYRPNPIRVVTIDVASTDFVVVPSRELPQTG